MKFLKNIRIGRISRKLSGPWLGWCFACKTTWDFVEAHSTTCDGGGFGMFPLCEKCWQERTPAERLPFYRELHALWGKPPLDPEYPDHDAQWAMIEKSVMAGL